MGSSDPLLIYGATGYTGRLLARAAKSRGLRPVLCGRDEVRLAPFATDLGLEYRVARLDARLEEALRGIRVVLHAAGPFSSTCSPMVSACLRAGVHYLDLSGEVAAMEGVRQSDAQARERHVMLMPGVGFDVVPSDCLALHVARRGRGARRLAIGISGLEGISRGSFRTVAEGVGQTVSIRRRGELRGIPPGTLVRAFDYGQGPRPSIAVSWGDVCTAYYSTGIPDITVFCEAIPSFQMMLMANRCFGGMLATEAGHVWLEALARVMPQGPTEAQRAAGHGIIVAEAEDERGHCFQSRLRTPEVYTFTCTTGLAIVERVLAGDLEVGFQTPARVYGPDFILAFEGVSLEDLSAPEVSVNGHTWAAGPAGN